MKTKFLLSFLLLSQILAVSGCARQESPDIAEGSVPAAVSVAEPEGPPDTAEETESWINHYYNRGIYYMDGYTYRQFPDGLYRRKEGSENWELLCAVSIPFGRGLTSYGSRLYFTCCQSDSDSMENRWNNSVFYYDCDTSEYGELLFSDDLIGNLEVCGQRLFIQTAEPGGAVTYHSYVLNETGKMTEEPAPEMTEDSGQEVIPSPSCAKLLDGKVLLQELKDEKDKRFFLRDVDTGDEQFLFDAWDVLAITKNGIYYFADMGTTLMYYSFAETAGKEITLSGPLTAAEISTGFYDVTWSPDALYLYGRFPDTLQILKVDPDRLSVEVIAEWDESEEGGSSMINQVDNEYFYHGDQAFPLTK